MTTLPPAVEPLAPGIYPGLPFIDYLALDAVSNTRIGQMEKSPAHYKANIGLEPRPCLTFGQLTHCGRLEPAALVERYAVMPDFENDVLNVTGSGDVPTNKKATKYYKNKVKEFSYVNSDKDSIDASQYLRMMQCVMAIDADDDARNLFSREGGTELTLIWIDEPTGLLCKARFDKHVPSLNAFVDLKTCEDIIAFERNLVYYAYHRQMSWYQHGWSVLNGGDLLTPYIVAVESKAPHCVVAAPMSDEAMDRGAERWRAALDRVAECTEANHWPGPKSPSAWRVPEWELNSGESIELIVGGQLTEV